MKHSLFWEPLLIIFLKVEILEICLSKADSDFNFAIISPSEDENLRNYIETELYSLWDRGLFTNSPIGFEPFILPFSNCLLVVSNFKNSDLSFSPVPILLRRPEPVVIHSYSINFTYFRWVTPISFKNTSNPIATNNILSKCFDNMSNVVDRCAQIDFDRFVSHSRSSSLKCIAMIDLFPPKLPEESSTSAFLDSYGFPNGKHITPSLNYPTAWQFTQRVRSGGYKPARDHFWLMPGSPVFRMFAFSLKPSLILEPSLEETVRKWIKEIVFRDSHQGLKSMIAEFYMAELGSSSFKNVQAFLIMESSESGRQIFTKFRSKPFNKIEIDKIYDFESFWEFSGDRLEAEMFENMFHGCQDPLLGITDFKNVIGEVDDVLLSKIMVHVWKSILGNHSHTYTRNGKRFLCRNSKEVQITQNSSDFPLFPFHELNFKVSRSKKLHLPFRVENPLSILQFVSCGYGAKEDAKTGSDAFWIPPSAMETLTESYDLFVWALVLISVVIFVSGMTLNDWMMKMGQNWNSNLCYAVQVCLKSLLEQGSPVPATILEKLSHPGRIFLGTCFLGGFLISTGYKNENMSNLIAPRTLKVPTTFSELVRRNYTIYSRTAEPDIRRLWELILDNRGLFTLNHRKSQGTIHFNFHFVLNGTYLPTVEDIKTEVKSGWESRSSNYLYESKSELRLLDKMWNKSILYSKNYIIENLDRLELFAPNYKKLNKTEKAKEVIELMNGYRQFEEYELFSSLWDCNNSAAVIFPKHLAQMYRQLLASVRQSARVGLGKETYFGKEVDFYFRGMIPVGVMGRLDGLKQSGIVDRWLRVLEEVMFSGIKNVAVKAPHTDEEVVGVRLRGNNILCVFYFLLIGLGCSVFGFIFESFFKRVINSVAKITLTFPSIIC